MTTKIKVITVCLTSAALVFGATACGSSDTTTTTPASTTTQVTKTTTTTTPPATTTVPAPTTLPNSKGGVKPIKPPSPATDPSTAECPSGFPQYDAANGLCYANGVQPPE